MARKVPCQFCKQRRRKCERSRETEPCERCIQMKRKCIPQDLSHNADTSDDDDFLEDDVGNTVELDAMNQQVKDLEDELQKLEITLNQQKALVKKEPSWEIRIVNGQVRLGTEIKTLEELMLYGQSVIRYLSPFGNTFRTTALKFERINPSFIKTAMHIVTRFQITDQNASAASISQRFSTGLVQFIQPKSVINRLIDNYFGCFNDTIPMLHEASYREHYRKLKDPMTDPITLAICAGSAISTCKHSFFNSQEKRYIGEHFYKHAMDILMEIFDDPDRALESLLVINLLQMFMITTLRLLESKKWAAIAVLLAANLTAENPDCTLGNPGMPLLLRVKYATIHRNSVLAQCVMAILEFIISNRRESIVHTNVKFDILPDESSQIQDLMDMMNHILDLSLHPATIVIVTQARHLAAGDVAELNFEQIVQYDEVVLDWWHSLPSYLKICREPFNCTKELVHKTTDLRKLLMACYIYTITLSIQGCLIQPRSEEGLESVNAVVRDRAIHLAIHSADMALLLAKKIESLDSICYSPSRILIRCIDSLMTLIQVQDEAMAKMARTKLDEYMKELSKSISPDHQVSPAASPYSILSVAPPGATPSVTELYKNYPLPGEALIYDIINTTVHKNTDTKVYMSSPPC